MKHNPFGNTVCADARGAGFARITGHIAAAPLLPAPLAEALGRLDIILDVARNQAGLISFREVKICPPIGELVLSGRLDPKQEDMALQGSITLGASSMLAGILPEELRFQAATARFDLHGALAAPKLALEAELEGFTSSITELSAALGASPKLHLTASAPARIESLTLTGDGSDRGLTVFGAVLKGTSGQLIEDHFLQAGLVQKGTFARRPQDSIAFVDAQGFLKPKLPQLIERLGGKSKMFAAALADWPDVSA